ncbi:hypothetical protein GLYMA_02G084700v4 [Glycine max]|uniref:Uncharacterized protein n=1 Tax=Glycine max TaxID=3847 RepID=A0A0R0L1T2_SOYBN|nr:hypothetical protein JHK87_003390 [Glycine soja]KAG5079468.1 hypothetical protein JHK86_003533 [Glycine max]KAH1059352.1 hypothetical protein GYH30_003411 [Glycine max]KAH1059353.1 hypothetical protein GYH30_003411 [Glycine max]KRH70341.1 hypothetical protein GLYMA_02G084700v4 [Glycine max]
MLSMLGHGLLIKPSSPLQTQTQTQLHFFSMVLEINLIIITSTTKTIKFPQSP